MAALPGILSSQPIEAPRTRADGNTAMITTTLENDLLPIVVPYRDRISHLLSFVPHMENFLKHVNFKILIVHQADNKEFNRGKLKNIGFLVASSSGPAVCFHDVDMLPMDDTCDYRIPSHTTHLAGRAEQFGFLMPYPEYVGGVIITPVREFSIVNGFSNEYWGWGQEDDDLWLRYQMAGLQIVGRPGRYRCLPHKPASRPPENVRRIKATMSLAAASTTSDILKRRIAQVLTTLTNYGEPERHIDPAKDGLTSLVYKTLSRRSLRSFLDFKMPISNMHEVLNVEL